MKQTLNKVNERLDKLKARSVLFRNGNKKWVSKIIDVECKRRSHEKR